MTSISLRVTGLTLAIALAVACGDSPSSPTAPPLPLAAESAHYRYFFSAGDSVEIDRQEVYVAWAMARLGVTLPRKIDYHKYTSRSDMGAGTGHSNTNGYAEPDKFAIHTLWSFDSHETVHVGSSLIGRPSDFFNEGIAVAFGTDPQKAEFEPRFNGEPVHESARRYRQQGLLVLPLSKVVTTASFREISDTVLSYRQSGSFVAFLMTRHGLDRLLQFFRISGRDDTLGAIEQRFQEAFGTTLAAAEADWLAFIG